MRSIVAGILVVTWCVRAAPAADAPALPVDRAAVTADQRAIAARAGKADPARHAEAAALVDEGVRLHDAAEFDAAIAKYQAAIELDPAWWGPFFEMSLTQGVRGEPVKALDAVLRAEALAPPTASIVGREGDVLDDLGFPALAIDAYDRALEIDPRSFQTLLNRGITLFRLERFSDAARDLVAAGEIRPDQASPWWHLANVYDREKNQPALRRALTKFLEVGPSDPRAGRAREWLALLDTQSVQAGPAATPSGDAASRPGGSDAAVGLTPGDVSLRVLMSTAGSDPKFTVVIGCEAQDAAASVAADVALWRAEVTLEGGERLDVPTEMKRFERSLSMGSGGNVARLLRCVRPRDPEWPRVEGLLAAVRMELRWAGVPPPAALPVAPGMFGVCLDPADLQWQFYWLGRAALRHDEELRRALGLPGDGRRSVDEEVLSLMALVGRPHEGVVEADGSPTNHRVASIDALAAAGLLRGYVLAEVLPARGVSIASLAPEDARLVDDYLVRVVIHRRAP